VSEKGQRNGQAGTLELWEASPRSCGDWWSGKPGVDSIIGVYDDVGAAMAASNDGQTNLTQVMFNTPGNIGDDGRIWVLVDGAAIFSAHCSASAAAAQRTLYGGQMRSFVLNAGRDCGR
jgi:hypothetical protein